MGLLVLSGGWGKDENRAALSGVADLVFHSL